MHNSFHFSTLASEVWRSLHALFKGDVLNGTSQKICGPICFLPISQKLSSCEGKWRKQSMSGKVRMDLKTSYIQFSMACMTSVVWCVEMWLSIGTNLVKCCLISIPSRPLMTARKARNLKTFKSGLHSGLIRFGQTQTHTPIITFITNHSLRNMHIKSQQRTIHNHIVKL